MATKMKVDPAGLHALAARLRDMHHNIPKVPDSLGLRPQATALFGEWNSTGFHNDSFDEGPGNGGGAYPTLAAAIDNHLRILSAGLDDTATAIDACAVRYERIDNGNARRMDT